MRHNVVPTKTQPTRRPARRRRTVERLSLVIVAAAALACVWLVTGGRVIAITPAAVPAPVGQEQDYSRFLHNEPKHAALACASCHQRARDNSISPAYDGKASLPGHKACTDCHLPQFVQQNIAMCAICHTSVADTRNPPVKNFPGLQSFNARFDHAQHNTGAAKPPAGCADCHTSSGRRAAALTIPARLNAHAECYTCHTPGAQANGRDIASCGVCHALGSYARTPPTGRSFAVGFNHATHGRGQGLGCNDCHNLRAGLPPRQQVTNTRPAQHFASGRAQTCMTCHNGRRAFGDENFSECVKCHKGATFRM